MILSSLKSLMTRFGVMLEAAMPPSPKGVAARGLRSKRSLTSSP